MKIEKISEVDPGVLLLEVARNARHIAPELQQAIAQFMRAWGAPRMTTKDFDKKLFGKGE